MPLPVAHVCVSAPWCKSNLQIVEIFSNTHSSATNARKVPTQERESLQKTNGFVRFICSAYEDAARKNSRCHIKLNWFIFDKWTHRLSHHFSSVFVSIETHSTIITVAGTHFDELQRNSIVPNKVLILRVRLLTFSVWRILAASASARDFKWECSNPHMR